MEYRNWFIVGARLLGLWVFYQGCLAGEAFIATAALPRETSLYPLPRATFDSPVHYFLLGACEMLLAAFLLFGIRPFADALFRRDARADLRYQALTAPPEEEDDYSEERREDDYDVDDEDRPGTPRG
jgi:hypothetical protein